MLDAALAGGKGQESEHAERRKFHEGHEIHDDGRAAHAQVVDDAHERDRCSCEMMHLRGGERHEVTDIFGKNCCDSAESCGPNHHHFRPSEEKSGQGSETFEDESENSTGARQRAGKLSDRERTQKSDTSAKYPSQYHRAGLVELCSDHGRYAKDTAADRGSHENRNGAPHP